jgi:hypothetical protein
MAGAQARPVNFGPPLLTFWAVYPRRNGCPFSSRQDSPLETSRYVWKDAHVLRRTACGNAVLVP